VIYVIVVCRWRAATVEEGKKRMRDFYKELAKIAGMKIIWMCGIAGTIPGILFHLYSDPSNLNPFNNSSILVLYTWIVICTTFLIMAIKRKKYQ